MSLKSKHKLSAGEFCPRLAKAGWPQAGAVSSFFFLFVFLIFSFHLASADMAGTGFKIDSDSINTGGNDFSVSGDIQMADTVGEIIVGESTSTNYSVSAGYRNMDESSVSIGVTLQSVNLSPDLGGMTGGTSTGSTLITVTTDNPAGYLLSMKSSVSPAMRSDRSVIPDYSPIGSVDIDGHPTPDFSFRLIVATSSFAFTPEGIDIVDRYRDNGTSLCNVVNGYDAASRCWDGLSITDRTISNRSIPTSGIGATTSIRFSVGIGGGSVQAEGLYSATTTITALAL